MQNASIISSPRHLQLTYTIPPRSFDLDLMLFYFLQLRMKSNIELTLTTLGGQEMARNSWKPVEFANVHLSAEDKAAFQKWWAHDEIDVTEQLSVCVSAGQKVTLSYSSEKNMYICSITCRVEGHVNENWCVTSRAGTFEQVIAVALFKYFVILDGVVLSTYAAEEEWG